MARTARTPTNEETRTQGLRSEPDPDDGDVDIVMKKRRTIETEVTVEKIFGVDNESAFADEKDKEDESDSILDMEKDAAENLSRMKNGAPEIEKSELEEEDEDGDDTSDENVKNQNYQVGDFVWGKIRSHPWWPGQIYNPSDASDYAVKLKQKGRLLVAYFGDGSFSWCRRSQLKPFVENFEQMSNQSSSKNFVYAINNALDEISRAVELETRKLYTQEKDHIEVPKPDNAGIRADADVPEGSIGKLLVSQYGAVKLLATARDISRENSSNSLLEFAVLKSWISSIYFARGGYKLCSYSPPVKIEGLVDLSKDGNSLEGDLIEKPDHTVPEVSADKLYKRRKQKSIVEHMKEDLDLYATSASAPKKRGRKKKTVEEVSEKAVSVNGEKKVNADEEEVDLKLTSVSSTLKKRGRKKKTVEEVSEKAVSVNGEKKVNADEAEVDLKLTSVSSTLKKRGRKKKTVEEVSEKAVSVNGEKKVDADEAEVDLKLTSVSSTLKKRGRKKKTVEGVSEKAVSVNGEKKVNADEADVDLTLTSVSSTAKKRGRKSKVVDEVNDKAEPGKSKVVDEVNDKAEPGKKKKKVNAVEAEVDLTLSSVSSDDDDDVKSKDDTEKSSLSREKKKSRYLSPPYLDLKKGTKSLHSRKDSDTNSDNIPDIGVRMAKAASLLISGLPALSKCNSAQKSSSKLLEDPRTGKSSQQHKKGKKANLNYLEIRSVPNEVLYEVRFLATDPLRLIEEKNLESITGFFSAYRNFVVVNGSDYKSFSKDKKRKSLSNSESAHVEVENGLKKKAGDSAVLSGSTEGSSGGTKNDLKKELPALIVTFPPGFSLPSRDDIIKRFSSFGALNEEETDVFYNSFCARLVYTNSSDAEEAFNVSIQNNPFGGANVNFRLRYPYSAQKNQKIPSAVEQIPPDDTISVPGNVALKLQFVKKKLEEITKMVDDSGDKFSEELQSNLESELKNLIEKVSVILR